MLHQQLCRARQRPESARADHKLAVGPAVADPDYRDRHRARAAPGGRLRHHGESDVGRHHLADRVKIAQPRPEMQPHAELCRMPCDVKLQGGCVGQADEIAGRHLVKIDQPAAGERPSTRDHQRQPILAESEPFDIVGQRMFGGKAEIGRARRDGGRDIGAFALLDIDVDVGMLAQERRKRLWEVFRQP